MLFSRRLPVWIVAIIASLLLGGCGLSLAEDVTPPPNYRPPTQAPEQPASAEVFPVVPPDLVQGKAIYEEKCQACHGATGMGDGEQADKLPNPAAPIGSAELAHQSTPIDWFNIVTNGNLEKFMPGFSGSLNDRQRWDVVAYALSLSTTPEEIEEGRVVYEANCATCHGVTGKGDGEQAASREPKPASWDDQSKLAKLSADNITAVIRGELAGHPSFADTLDEAQQYAVAAHLRQLSFAASGAAGEIASAQTPEAGTPEAGTLEPGTPVSGTPVSGTPDADSTIPAEDLVLDTITITGKVTNATPGGTVPEGLEVLLSAYESMSPAFEVTAPVDKEGNFIFNGVEFSPDLVYITQVDANGLTFNSDILHGADVSSPIADLSLKIYDTTSETTGLRTDRLHVFFDFTNPGTVQVVNLFIISNVGDKVVASAQEGEPVVRFPLPEGAANLAFQEGKMGERYVETENGFGDRMSIAPGIGQHQILYAYEMPYDRSLSLDLTVPLPVDAAIVMVPPSGVRLKSAQLTDAGERSVQGMAFQMYQNNTALNAGDTLEMNLSGRVGSGTAEVGGDSLLYVLIGGGVFGVALAAAGFWLYRRRQSDAVDEVDEDLPGDVVQEETSESLLEAIVALDDQHAAGSLPEEAYQERREDLKARLAEAVRREKGE